MTRSAISPRLAINTFSNIWDGAIRRGRRGDSRLTLLALTDPEKRLAKLNRPAVFSEHFSDDATGFCFDFVHDFHRLDNANDCLFSDGLTYFNKRRRIRRCSAVKRAYHWRHDLFHRDAFD